MNTIYILIVVFSIGNGGAGISAEFNSLETCQAAYSELIKQTKFGRNFVVSTCAKK